MNGPKDCQHSEATNQSQQQQQQQPSSQQVGLHTGTDPGHLVLAKALLTSDYSALDSTKVQTFQQSSTLNPLLQQQQQQQVLQESTTS